MRLPEQPGEGKPENEEKGGRGAPGGGEEPPRSQAPDFPTWQVFFPQTPPGEIAFSSVCSGLDCFQPAGRGWCGRWEPLLLPSVPVWAGRGRPTPQGGVLGGGVSQPGAGSGEEGCPSWVQRSYGSP